MRSFNLNDDEIWLIKKMRTLTVVQHRVVHLLVRQMADRSPVSQADNIVSLDHVDQHPHPRREIIDVLPEKLSTDPNTGDGK